MNLIPWIGGIGGLAIVGLTGLWLHAEGRIEAKSEQIGDLKSRLETAEDRANEWYETAKGYETDLAIRNVEASISADRESRAQSDLQWYRRQLASAQQDPVVVERLGDCAGAIMYTGSELSLRNDVTRGIVASIAGSRGLDAALFASSGLSDSSRALLAGGPATDNVAGTNPPD